MERGADVTAERGSNPMVVILRRPGSGRDSAKDVNKAAEN